jgi:hypothetical protein
MGFFSVTSAASCSKNRFNDTFTRTLTSAGGLLPPRSNTKEDIEQEIAESTEKSHSECDRVFSALSLLPPVQKNRFNDTFTRTLTSAG